MAACNEITGFSQLGRSSFLPGNRSFLLGSKQNRLCFVSPALLEQRRRGRLRSVEKAAATPVVATISEEVVKLVAGKQQQKLKVRAALTVRRKLKEDLKEVIVNQLDALSDKIGRNVVLELISTEINPRTKKPKKSGETVIKDWYEKKNVKGERVVYTAEFDVDSAFGEPGAITVVNRHQKEFFLEGVVIEGFACGPVHFPCDSWVQSTKDLPTKRIFFSNKVSIILCTC
ncbi:hypothetical protein BHE74_00018866 [Ensete ventricosum]|nr:hypothetical protein BHE74_00018866 [Ensete ventricosum]